MESTRCFIFGVDTSNPVKEAKYANNDIKTDEFVYRAAVSALNFVASDLRASIRLRIPEYGSEERFERFFPFEPFVKAGMDLAFTHRKATGKSKRSAYGNAILTERIGTPMSYEENAFLERLIVLRHKIWSDMVGSSYWCSVAARTVLGTMTTRFPPVCGVVSFCKRKPSSLFLTMLAIAKDSGIPILNAHRIKSKIEERVKESRIEVSQMSPCNAIMDELHSVLFAMAKTFDPERAMERIRNRFSIAGIGTE